MMVKPAQTQTPATPDSAVDILVVDDKRDTREAVIAFLELEGFETRHAEDGLQALGKVMEHMPDLILLDANMPDMDGFEMLETLRQDPATARIPVIMVTALNDASDVARAFHLGVTDYLIKPVQMEILINRVQTYLRIRDLERQVRALEDQARRVAAHANVLAQYVQVGAPEPVRRAVEEMRGLSEPFGAPKVEETAV